MASLLHRIGGYYDGDYHGGNLTVGLRAGARLLTEIGWSRDAIAASGAALDHPHASVRAGFNVYEFDDTGALSSITAHVVDPLRGGFARQAIDREPAGTRRAS